MILYTDTSALVKKYVHEAGSDEVLLFFNQYAIIGTASLTQVEMAAAMVKAIHQGWVDESEMNSAWKDFLSHWHAYTRLPSSGGIIERATDLAWKHRLRAYDSIHLASALTWRATLGEETTFACFDRRLQQAALEEGLVVWPKN